MSVVRGYDAVKMVAMKADLQYPERMRPTRMRKLVATKAQVL